jgi:hypothetical protein
VSLLVWHYSHKILNKNNYYLLRIMKYRQQIDHCQGNPAGASVSKDANTEGGIALRDLLQQASPISNSDYAKLIIWAFLAGFAEQFVLDTVSRFVSGRETDIKNAA